MSSWTDFKLKIILNCNVHSVLAEFFVGVFRHIISTVSCLVMGGMLDCFEEVIPNGHVNFTSHIQLVVALEALSSKCQIDFAIIWRVV